MVNHQTEGLKPSAIVWGASAKHARGQKVGLDHVLDDEDGEFDLTPINC